MIRWTAVVIAALAGAGAAQEKKSPLVGPIEYLWPKGAPGATGEGEKDKPSLSLYLAPAEKATGIAVVVCPGGGYGGLAKDHEGHQVGLWLNQHGISGFILTYRHSPYRQPVPMLDVQRAIRTVRSRAAEWKVDPKKIGVLGFSAGGHLASTAVTHFDDGKADAEDAVERAGCRPDFGVLVYPVIAFGEPFTHKGSQKNLLGEKNDDPELVRFYSSEKQVTEKTPPCFLIHTTEDKAVPPENSLVFYAALRKAKVSAEMHIYEKGPHGFGLGNDKNPELKAWPDRCAAWIKGVMIK